jgi:hypothetical protein
MSEIEEGELNSDDENEAHAPNGDVESGELSSDSKHVYYDNEEVSLVVVPKHATIFKFNSD